MPLTCGCEGDEFAWYFYRPADFSQLDTRRRKRCSSCQTLIDIGTDVAKFVRYRNPNGDIELRIHDYDEAAEVPLAPMHLCEECAGLFFSLEDLGFECVLPDENMRELVREYAAVYRAGKE